jgi:hypothetical protein
MSENSRTLIDVDYNPDPWEVDESPASVVAKIEAAKQANKKFVELIEDGATGAPIWISISNITAVYTQEPGDEESEQRL